MKRLSRKQLEALYGISICAVQNWKAEFIGWMVYHAITEQLLLIADSLNDVRQHFKEIA